MENKGPQIKKMFSDDHLSTQGDRCEGTKHRSPCQHVAAFIALLSYTENRGYRRKRLCEYHAQRFCERFNLTLPGQTDLVFATQPTERPYYFTTMIRIPIGMVEALDRAWKRGHAKSRTALVTKILAAWLKEGV